MAKSFYALGEHLVSGRIRLPQDQISCHAITTNVLAQMPTKRSDARFLSNLYAPWLAYEIPRVAVTPTLVLEDPVVNTTFSEGLLRVRVPDISLVNQLTYATTIYLVVFFVDTGDPATSPLIGYDDIGPVVMAENATYVYKSSPDGLIQIALP